MIKQNKMPVVLALLVFSWVVALFGIAIGFYCFIYKIPRGHFLLVGTFTILVSLLFASLIRILANVGQIIFDFNNNFVSQAKNLNQNLILQAQSLNQNLTLQAQSLNQNLTLQAQSLIKNLILQIQNLERSLNSQILTLGKELILKDEVLSQAQALETKEILIQFEKMKNSLDLISCDLKDSNKNIFQIRTFFEEIERHLDLKK